MKKILLILVTGLMFIGCSDRDSTVVSHNLSKQADMFEINRRVVFYNGINGEYILTIMGKCSIKSTSRKLEVTCKVGENEYKKHYLGLSDNVTYFAEQINSKNVSRFHYEVVFKPQVIIPDIDFKGSFEDLIDNRSN